MWKFHDFSITRILREINFRDSRSAKSPILTHLEAINFVHLGIFAIFKCENFIKTKIQSLQNYSKIAVFTRKI